VARIGLLLTLVAALAGAGLAASASGSSRGGPTASAASACAIQPVTSPRDPSNPLALPTPPGSDPLHGAHFFIDGPRHGVVAQTIENLLGLNNSSYSDSDTWAAFKAAVIAKLPSVSATIAHEVEEYFKIGDEEETQSVSLYAEGGGYTGIYNQVTKLLCDNMLADPTPDTVPVFSTFFAYPKGQFCPSATALEQWWATFKDDVNGMVAAIGQRRSVVLIEIDSIGTISCLHGLALRLWLRELSYEIASFATLPHVIAYQEAGSEDETSAPNAARFLVDVGVDKIRGFFTNDTHLNWSSKEIAWADKVAARVKKIYAAQKPPVDYTPYYVINTAQNGRGPLLDRTPGHHGVEELCNPPGRGLGRIPTADTQPTWDGHTFPLLDAFLWTGVPGRSHGTTCYPGAKPAGVFDPRYALELAENANQQLGPGYPSSPY